MTWFVYCTKDHILWGRHIRNIYALDHDNVILEDGYKHKSSAKRFIRTYGHSRSCCLIFTYEEVVSGDFLKIVYTFKELTQ
jgi:hypothetical protein